MAFFQPIIAFCAMAFLSLGDTFAAIIGLTLGKRKFSGMKKSVEGSLACFAASLIFAMIYIKNPFEALVGALAATGAELWKIPVDDNVKIPLISGFFMMIVSIFPFQ